MIRKQLKRLRNIKNINLKNINFADQLKQIRKRQFSTILIIALLAAVLTSSMFFLGFYSNAQLKLSDYLYGGGQPLSNIVLIAVDDQSIQGIGRWPWARGNFTEAVGWLEESKVVAFDVAFFERSDNDIDLKLANAVANAGNVVMPAEYTEFESKDGKVYGKGLLEVIPEIMNASADIGYINVITDRDGITRAVNLNLEGKYDQFANAILRQYMKKTIPKENRFLIKYIGKPDTYKRYSFIDVIKGKYTKDEFKDKIVLIGATAPDLHDNYFVPTSSGKAMPGVEIHANLIQQVLTGKKLHTAPDKFTIISILFAAFAVAIAVFYTPLWASIFIALGGIVLYIFLVITVFNYGMILNIVYLPITTLVTYVSTVIYMYLSEKKSRKKVLGAFEKYVSKEVIKHIMENPEKLKLGGDRREITIFFSDIRGFTTISEKLSPEDLVQLLNEYLTEMTNIILKNNGVVDKYMGDAIMAFWNAPLDQPKHAELACKSCLEMEKRLKELQKGWTEQGVPPLEIGIGLNTGQVVVGNMGSYDRFDYTAMGDTVNTGSRLEGLNKQYGTRIIISETTKKQIENLPFLVRKLDKVAVKGKKEPITIYELASFKEEAKDWYYKVIEHFEKGLEHYFGQEWDKATEEFHKALKLRPEDGPSKAFVERCAYSKEHPPGKDWDGVCVMKTK